MIWARLQCLLRGHVDTWHGRNGIIHCDRCDTPLKRCLHCPDGHYGYYYGQEHKTFCLCGREGITCGGERL